MNPSPLIRFAVRKRFIFVLIIALVLGTACERQATTVVPQSNLPTLPAGSEAATSAATASGVSTVAGSTTAPTAVRTATVQAGAPTPLPTSVAVNTEPAPTSTPITGPTMKTNIFLIAINGATDSNKIGCGDAVLPVDRQIAQTTSVLTNTMKDLLSLHDHDYGQSGLVNALYSARLNVDGVTLVNGKATIKLSGSLNLGGVCDNPRVKAQLEQTALQFSTVKQVEIFINNVPLDKALSLQ